MPKLLMTCNRPSCHTHCRMFFFNIRAIKYGSVLKISTVYGEKELKGRLHKYTYQTCIFQNMEYGKLKTVTPLRYIKKQRTRRIRFIYLCSYFIFPVYYCLFSRDMFLTPSFTLSLFLFIFLIFLLFLFFSHSFPLLKKTRRKQKCLEQTTYRRHPSS